MIITEDKMNIKVKTKILTVVLIILSSWLSGCGESEKSSPTPTNTPISSPTFTPKPTDTPLPTPTETPQIDYSGIYYPHEMNSVAWYTVTVDGEFNGYTSFAVVDTQTLEMGELVYLIENHDETNKFTNYDYIEFLPDAVLLHQFDMNLDTGLSLESPFNPPQPVARFPLEVGAIWSVETESNGEIINYSYEVSSKEDVSVFAGDYEDCYRIDRTRDGEMNFVEYYCPGVVRPKFSFNNVNIWVELELMFTTTARVFIEEIAATEAYCGLSFKAKGFDQNEQVALMVYPPEGESFFSGESAITEQTIIVYPFYPNDIPGLWMFDFIGKDNNDAYYMYDWTGECMEE